MTTYLIRRFFQSFIFIFLAAFTVYTVLVMLMPDGPYYRYTHFTTDLPFPQVVQGPKELEDRYELDKPWPLNFLSWLYDPSDTTTTYVNLNSGNVEERPIGIDIAIGDFHVRGSGILTGDFGTSASYARTNVPVARLISERFGNTFWLIMMSLGISLLVGIPLGIICATRPGSRLDHVVTFFAFAGLSVPPFVLGLLLIIGFAVLPSTLRLLNDWNWVPQLPAGGLGDTENFVDRLRHMLLPAVTLAIPQVAALARYSRFSMLDVMRQDYIRTAWAKGLSRRRVFFKHAFRNALLPIITIMGLILPGLVSGAIVIESVFAYPGMGQLYYRGLGGCLATISLLSQDPPPCPRIGYFPIDYPIALSMTIIVIVVVALSNVMADLLYAAADPRVNYKAQSRT